MNRFFLSLGLWIGICVGFTGCVMPTQNYSQHPPRIYLMLVVPDGLQPESIGSRREAIVSYLLATGLLASREDLVRDPADADRIVRAELTEDGFKLYFVDPVTERAVVYEPYDMPSDYGYYDGLIFTLAPGSRYPRRHDKDDQHPAKPGAKPAESMPPGKDQHHPQPPTPPDRPGWKPQPKHDTPPQNPAPNQTPDPTKTKPRSGPPGDHAKPEPSGDVPHARNGDDRPHGTNAGAPTAPRTLPPPHHDGSGPRNEDRKKDDSKKDDSSSNKAPNKTDPAVVPAR